MRSPSPDKMTITKSGDSEGWQIVRRAGMVWVEVLSGSAPGSRPAADSAHCVNVEYRLFSSIEPA